MTTPKYLEAEVHAEGPLWGRHLLLVDTYDLSVIKSKISRHVAQCHGKDWQEIALKLSRNAEWEFEDYQG